MAARSVLSHSIIKPKSGTNTATPLILMHGLFGQKSNLRSIANSELISKNRTCYLLDLRNHGDSFHSNNMHFSSMVDDVVHFMNTLNIEKANILGHSYGGKIGYLMALMYPQFVSSLLALDIAPKAYTSRNPVYIELLQLFQSLPQREFSDRNEIETYVMERVDGHFSLFEIKFLTATLVPKTHDKNNKEWTWKMNIDAMLDQIDNITRFDIDDAAYLTYDGPTCVIRGGNSTFVNDEDLSGIREQFPNAKMMTVEGASHYLHIEKPKETIQCVEKALAEAE